MLKILLPIKPEYAEQILNRTKKYEYRKQRCKRNDIQSIVIYETAPIKKVVGEVEVTKIIENTPSKLWEETNQYGGIEKSKYNQYFKNKNKAFAYVLGKVNKYDIPKELKDFNINFYPQSYVYLKDNK